MPRRVVLVVATLAVVAAATAGVVLYASGSAKPRELRYGGLMYMGVTEVTQGRAEANLGRLRRGRGTLAGKPVFVAGKPVFVAPGLPPGAIALQLADGHFDAYQLMRSGQGGR